MRLFILCVTTVFFITFIPNMASAEIDYRCLNNCVNNGANTSVCMPKCSYTMRNKSTTSPAHKAKKDPHNQFSTIESTESIIIKPHQTQNTHSTDNYYCISNCLKEKLQYNFCEDKCTAKPEVVNRPR